jgi:hypothetical protein
LGLQVLHLHGIVASQPFLDSLFASVPNVRDLVLEFIDSQASLPDTGGGHSLDISGISQLQQLQHLSLLVEDVYFNGAGQIAQLQQLTSLKVVIMGDGVLVFRSPVSGSPNGPSSLRCIQVAMPSVFDVTECLEGLHAMETVEALRVRLGSRIAGSCSGDRHWAIKPGSILANATKLRLLTVDCDTMKIEVLPPSLIRLHVFASKFQHSNLITEELNTLQELCWNGKQYDLLQLNSM